MSAIFAQHAAAYRQSKFRKFMEEVVKGAYSVPATTSFEFLALEWLQQDYTKSHVDAVKGCRSRVHARTLKLKTLNVYVDVLSTVSESVKSNSDMSMYKDQLKFLDTVMNGITLDVPK